jgi:hypothetical protein
MNSPAMAVLKEQYDVTTELASTIMRILKNKHDLQAKSALDPVRIHVNEIARHSNLATFKIREYLGNPVWMQQVWFKMGGKTMLAAPIFTKNQLIFP